MNDLVWYASYGSNILKNRFMCYIQGGKLEGSTKEYDGCSNKKPPIEEVSIIIPHELYFSKRSRTWENKAVAFIKSQINEKSKTYGRMYLITKQQFIEIVRQESCYRPNDSSINIDFESTVANGETQIPPNWYSRIIYLGAEKGYPIFTFTARWNDNEISPNAPGGKYLCTIIKGLKETFNLIDYEIINYLKNVEGIRRRINEQEMKRIIEST